MTYRAVLNDKTIATASDDAVKHVEGNVYFPPDAVNRDLLEQSNTHTRCYWKGKASYYHVNAGDRVAEDAAFYYPNPWPLARGLKDYVAFWRNVTVERS
jgi:uncharacterized protein (DUF427 family)